MKVAHTCALCPLMMLEYRRFYDPIPNILAKCIQWIVRQQWNHPKLPISKKTIASLDGEIYKAMESPHHALEPRLVFTYKKLYNWKWKTCTSSTTPPPTVQISKRKWKNNYCIRSGEQGLNEVYMLFNGMNIIYLMHSWFDRHNNNKYMS